MFQDLDVLINAAREGNPTITRFEDSVFTGDYVTGDVGSAYLQEIESVRGEAVT